ncbi:MAG: response regulator [Elusimicrobia bacterium]|nr:response regulator [Elusimicrobiota bacterium]
MPDKKKILVVDDNAPFIELMKGALSQDYELSAAENGTEGLRLALENIPDLVLLDVNMPGLNGVEFARKMAADPRAAKVPIIVITASDYNTLTQRLLYNEHNVKLFLTKLTPVETLLDKISRTLSGAA